MSSSLGFSDPVPLDELPSDADPRDDGARLWVGNMDTRITEFNMLKILQKYGTLKKLDFLYNKIGPDKGKPRGYCFVTYTSKEDAERAKKALGGKLALSKRLYVKEAHVLSQSSSKPETKPGQTSAEDKIREIEAKLKSMEQTEDQFSVTQPSLPVVVRQKQSSNRATGYQATRHSNSAPYKKNFRR